MKLIRLPEVMARTGLARATIYAATSRGDFPRQHKIGPRAVAWVASDIDKWAKARVTARGAA